MSATGSVEASRATPADPAQLQIRLLGPFECVRQGEPVPHSAWRTRPTLTLFKVLLDERDRTLPFERLIDCVWPEGDPEAARHSLRVAVRTLRRALEPELMHGAASRFVRTEQGGYRFDTARSDIDVDAFLTARQRALALDQRGDADAVLPAYLEAAALYRGEYLADDPYAEWAFSTRERLQSAYLGVLDRLSDLLAGQREWEHSIAWLERAIAIDPLREELYRRLMHAHQAQGRRSHALAAFERCRRELRTELGVAPAEETVRLRDAIVRQTTRAAPQGDVHLDGGQLPELQLAFVGRAAEQQQLAVAWARAQREPGQLVVVSGLPGVGKTRLARHFAETLEQTHGPATAASRARWIICYEAEAGIPFAPLTRLLATWLDRAPSLGERQRLEPYAAAIAQLLPQAGALIPAAQRAPDLPQPVIEMGRLLEALTQAVRVMLGGGAGLLVLDDLHWADASTLLWLGYALRRADTGLLMLATLRLSEPAPEGLGQLLASARREERLTELALGPLAAAELAELLPVGSHAPDEQRRHRLGARLHQLTAGQPLLVVETLRDLARCGVLLVDESGQWRVAADAERGWAQGVPRRAVRELTEARLARLPKSARRAFTAICVIGTETSARLVAEITAESHESTLTALDLLLERQLLRPAEDGHGYVVEHPLLQDAVYTQLSPGRRQDWHLRVAGALANQSGKLPTPAAGQILRHLVAADAPPQEIIDAALAAGDSALQHAAFGEAVAGYSTARELLARQLPATEPRTAFAHVSERLADALAGAGRWSEAATLYEELIDAATTVVERSRLRRKLAAVLGDVLGRFDAALALLDNAEAELTESAPAELELELGQIARARSAAYFFRSDYHAAIEHSERALELWHGRTGIERDEVELLIRVGQAEQRLGMLDAAERRYRTARARARALGDRLLEVSAEASLGPALMHRGRLAQSLEAQDQVVRFGAELGFPRIELVALTNRANVLLHLGRLAEARDGQTAAIALAETLDARYTVMHALVSLGEALMRLGDFERARQTLERGIALAEEIGNQQRRGHAYLHLSELALLGEDGRGARQLAEQGMAIGRAIDDVHAQREGCTLLARTLLALGLPDEAARSAGEGLEVARQGGFVLSEGRNQAALGAALSMLGKDAKAHSAWSTAEHIFRLADARYDLAQTLYLRASAALSGSERMVELAAAHDLALTTGARPLARIISQAASQPI